LAASKKKADQDEDQFLGWMNRDGTGMSAFGGIRWLGAGGSSSPRILVLLTSDHVGNLERPWSDLHIRHRDLLLYWGDTRSSQTTQPRGNHKLRLAWEKVQAEPREHHPLVLYFQRRAKGWVTFAGLGHLAHLESRAFLDGRSWIENELAYVQFLPAESVSVDWLNSWRDNQSFASVGGAPAEYLDWVRGRGPAESGLPDEEILRLITGKHRAEIRGLASGPFEPPPGATVPARSTRAGVTSFRRDAAVRAWVYERAAGRCELCLATAPFVTDDDEGFLEIHHVVRLAEGGRDTVDNTVALCPNCHRRCHHGKDRKEQTERLFAQVRSLAR
jgi:hypothetical protein